MPCYKCSNGKWKYGVRGNCQFDSEGHCREAEQAIHARDNKKPKKSTKDYQDILSTEDCVLEALEKALKKN